MAEDIRNTRSTAGIKEFEQSYHAPHCIVLDSTYCSMGRMIAYKACQETGYAYYDAVILLELVPEFGLAKDDVDAYESKLRSRRYSKEELLEDPSFARISEAFDKAIGIALAKGPCLIHDRATKEEILAKGYTCINAITYATDMKAKIVKARISPLYHDTKEDADVVKGILEEDNIRRNVHRLHSDTEWGELSTYDLCLNTDAFGRDFSAKLLAKAMNPSA